jgi:primosomal protein N' (replication factor Y) (superfamily II helicase)
MQYAAKQDYLGFYQEEIAIRQLFNYPPFSHLAKILFSGPDAQQTLETAESIREKLISHLPKTFEITPTVPCGHAKVKDLYRYQFLLRASSMFPLNKALLLAQQECPLPSKIRLFVDVNPSSTFF